MRILVTGGAGFIGSHVVDAYINSGHEVWVLDDLSRGKRENVNPRAHLIRKDLRSSDLGGVLAERRFDCVNHHAAQIDVRASVADPARDAEINIIGSLNILEAARLHGVPRVVFASTGGAIYGEQQQYPATEHHPTVPISPYGVAKLTIEHYLEYYRQVHGLKYVVLRYANVYGPRQDSEGEAGVVAIFCGRALDGQRLVIYGDGEQTRDYVYVKDVARANLSALNYLAETVQRVEPVEPGESIESRTSADYRISRSNAQPMGNTFNIGTGIETSVNALAAMLFEAADTECPVIHEPARVGEQKRSVIDPTKAEHVLGWRPNASLKDGLLETVAWFRSRNTATK